MGRKYYTSEEKLAAVKLYIQYDFSPSAVIYQLGYPSRNRLRSWYEEYKETGKFTIKGNHSKYTAEQRKAAVQYYLEHGRSIGRTIKALGYPKKTMLCQWLKEDLAPNQRKWYCKAGTALVRYTEEEKQKIVIEYLTRQKTPTEINKTYGISSTTVYKWRNRYLIGKQEVKMPKKPLNIQLNEDDPEELKARIHDLQKQAEDLEQQVYNLRLEKDVLEKAAEILKKGQGISLSTLTNREKAIVINALRGKYPLKRLLISLQIAKSSYCYQVIAMKTDRYFALREEVRNIFIESKERYGYRRIHAVMKTNNKPVSEKVIRRLMREEDLSVRRIKRKKYNSYQGEITPAVENVINRDFHAKKPNEKWLTDITEFHIPAGKVYLSPIIDCFDGLPVSWTIGQSPDANLVNTMLDEAVLTLKEDEKPLVHSDRGAHYRWPGWIERMEAAGLTRSMSKKGCSPDNSACEGFFGRLKNEMFYGVSWQGVSIDSFINELDQYIRWYANDRIKLSLGGKSPIEFRRSLGLLMT